MADISAAALSDDPTPFRPTSGARLAARQFLRNPAATIGFCVLVALVAIAILAPWISPYDPVQIRLSAKLRPPGAQYWLGTDHFGRDVFSRLMHGARISLSVGLLVVSFALTFGVPLGVVSGYVGGKLDAVLMRIVDAFLTFPPLLLAVAIVGLLGPDIQNVMIALGVVQAPVLARLVRASTLAAREETYVTAVRALGASPARIVILHVLRNVLSPIVVQITIGFSAAVVAEASLSFLGLGTQPPTPSWGRDLAEARRFMSDAPWLFLSPTATILLAVLSINFLGDGLRDALDPRSWVSRGRVEKRANR